jgi:nucleoid DNA-binding protein
MPENKTGESIEIPENVLQTYKVSKTLKVFQP